MKKYLPFVLTVILLVVAASIFFIFNNKNKISEEPVSEISEISASYLVDPLFSPANGGNIDTSEPSVNFENNEDIPVDFPVDITIFSGARIFDIRLEEKELTKVFFITQADFNEVKNYYKSNLEVEGWEMPPSFETEGAVLYMARKGDRSLSIDISAGESGTIFVISYGAYYAPISE